MYLINGLFVQCCSNGEISSITIRKKTTKKIENIHSNATISLKSSQQQNEYVFVENYENKLKRDEMKKKEEQRE